MASSDLTLEQIYNFFKEKGNIVKNRELVHHFKRYLTDPATKDDARSKFKHYVNILAQTKTEGGEKFLVLKTKYLELIPKSPQYDPCHSLGIPVISPVHSPLACSPTRQPPPYRPPPPVMSPSVSLDNISLNSVMSMESTPQAPPRRRSTGQKIVDESNAKADNVEGDELQISVKERTQKFNRMASVEDELSPSTKKTIEKKPENKGGNGADEEDGASVTSLEPKKCMEWCVTASKGDLQELVKLAKDEPRLVNRKDPFTTVLHWGAKYGNAEIIKVFAGRYKVDVNGRTNGGYTPLHLAAQFGHKNIFKLLIEVYKADSKIRDYSGRFPEYYLLAKEQKGGKENVRKIKSRKKQSDKDLSFLRIGSLNVRVKKTTEAFSNFLGVGSGGSINPLDSMTEKVHKGWGSADNLNQDLITGKGNYVKKKSRKPQATSGLSSMPGTPKQLMRNNNPRFGNNDSDSDSAAGFDSQWKN